MDTMKVVLNRNEYGDPLDEGNRAFWDSGLIHSRHLRNPSANFLKNPLKALRKSYSVRYFQECTNAPVRALLPQFSLVYKSEEGDMTLMAIPLSCQGFLRGDLYDLLLNYSTLPCGPLRLFFEMPPALERPTMRMKRAFRMAQSLTEFIGEDPSEVKLYRAKLPELSSTARRVRNILENYEAWRNRSNAQEIAISTFKNITLSTGTMFLNRARMYVLEAPEIWIKSPYALSVFGRLTRNALFKRPLLFKNYKSSEDFVEALRKWEGLVKNNEGWMKAFDYLKAQKELSKEASMKAVWEESLNTSPHHFDTEKIGLDSFICYL